MPAQLRAFAAAVCAGIASALVYDVLRIVRRAAHAGPVLTGAADLLFWLAAALMTAGAGALCGVEGLRLYVLLGAACGFAAWEACARCTLRWLRRGKNRTQ